MTNILQRKGEDRKHGGVKTDKNKSTFCRDVD